MGALHLRRHPGRINTTSSTTTTSSSDSDKDDDWCLLDNNNNNIDNDHHDHEVSLDHRHDSLAASVSKLLAALGEDISRNGLLKTPSRVARALLSATRGYRLSPADTIGGALFDEAGAGNGVGSGGGSGGMVIVQGSELFSTCECCMLPFRSRCHIAYIPSGQRVVGLSKLPRVADILAARLQTPQRLVNEVAQALTNGFGPLGVAVVAECWHVDQQQAWLRSTVSARTGRFDEPDSDDWDEFLTMLSIDGVEVGKRHVLCPLLEWSEVGGTSEVDFKAVVEAVECMLEVIGEDPSREELKLTASRYARWLVSSTEGSRLNLGSLAVVHKEADYTGWSQFVMDLPFCSQCEHHLLPFSGAVHVGFIGERSWRVNRKALETIVHVYSRRLQVQERLTRQIAEAVMNLGGGVGGVMVVAEASHVCMIARGVRKAGTSTSTLATLGTFVTDAKSRNKFLQMIAAAKRSRRSSDF